jgi:hypothetical protein
MASSGENPTAAEETPNAVLTRKDGATHEMESGNVAEVSTVGSGL